MAEEEQLFLMDWVMENKEKVKAKAISLKQPWAWLVVNGIKTIENRTWQIKHEGELYIHASKAQDKEAYQALIDEGVMMPNLEDMPVGGIIGKVVIKEIVTKSKNEWFQKGCYGHVLEKAEKINYIPCSGKLGVFDISI